MLIYRKNNKIKDNETDLYSTTYLLIFMNIWEGSNMGSLISVPLSNVVRSFTKSEVIDLIIWYWYELTIRCLYLENEITLLIKLLLNLQSTALFFFINFFQLANL